MRTQKKVRKKDKLNIAWWLIYIAVVSCIAITIFSTAQYTSQSEESAKIVIGKPIIELANVTQDEINGVQTKIQFDVQNFETDNPDVTSDVTMLYSVQILKNSNIDLTYTLYKNEIAPENKIEMTANNETLDYTMTYTEKQTDSYILVVNFNGIPSPEDVANAIKININADQYIASDS